MAVTSPRGIRKELVEGVVVVLTALLEVNEGRLCGATEAWVIVNAIVAKRLV